MMPHTTPRTPLSAACPLVVLTTIVLASPGCGARANRPVVHPVRGLVTLDGRPIEGVGLSLRPVVKGEGLSAFGKTLADGSYTLSSTRGGRIGAGAVAGEYAVMLDKFTSVRPDAVPPQFGPAENDPSRQVQQWFSRREMDVLDADGKAMRVVILGLLPEAYADVETSGLRVTVRPGRNSGPEFEFRLRRDFRGATPGD
jgi:hypothetical protein